MEQTIAFNQHLQGHGEAVSYCLDHLQEKMNHDLLSLVDQCSSEEELEFLFPEITRIQHHDVAVLESWKNHTNWMQSLSPSEKEELANLEPTETDSSNISQGDIATTEPWEMQLYKDLKKKSHYSALQDQLKFIVKPELRRHHESYIQEQAIAQNRQGLIPNNWQEVPDFTVTNLYHYLKNSDPWSNQLK